MAFVSTFTEFAMMDTRTTSGALVLPLTTDIPGRIINIKDTYGAFTRSSLTVYTQGGETFEDGTNFRVLNCAYDHMQVYTASTSRWYITGGTYQNFDTANVAIISTLQTYNWASLCNHPNLGYGSTFNPPALGEISLLDNIFTSSTASLVSTFIEIGNLNAMPFNVSPGAAFRWMIGVESSPQPTTGLDFKIKRWTSFSNANSNFYGANSSTLQDVTIWNQAANPSIPPSLIHTGPIIMSTLGPGVQASPGVMRFVNQNATSFIQFGSTINNTAGGTLAFTSVGGSPEWMRINTGLAGNPYSVVRVGINCNAPAFMLDVRGTARFSTVVVGENVTAFSSFGGAVANTFGVALALTRGDAYKIAGTAWTNTSDQRIKENIIDANLDLCYSNTKNLRLRKFNFISSVIETGDIYDKSVLGFVAQEVAPIIPKSVKEISFLGYDNLKTLDADQINMTTFGALQKTITDKEALESTVFSLQTLNGTLVNRISTLEGKLFNLY